MRSKRLGLDGGQNEIGVKRRKKSRCLYDKIKEKRERQKQKIATEAATQ